MNDSLTGPSSTHTV